MNMPVLTVAELRDRLAELPGDYEVWSSIDDDDGIPTIRPVLLADVDPDLHEVHLR